MPCHIFIYIHLFPVAILAQACYRAATEHAASNPMYQKMIAEIIRQLLNKLKDYRKNCFDTLDLNLLRFETSPEQSKHVKYHIVEDLETGEVLLSTDQKSWMSIEEPHSDINMAEAQKKQWQSDWKKTQKEAKHQSQASIHLAKARDNNRQKVTDMTDREIQTRGSASRHEPFRI